jgi:hypothetical protein
MEKIGDTVKRFLGKVERADGRRQAAIVRTAGKGFTKIPNWIYDRGISLQAIAVYGLLSRHCWGKDWCIVRQEELARAGRIDRGKLIEYLRELQTTGIIKIRRRGWGKPNLYRLLRQ